MQPTPDNALKQCKDILATDPCDFDALLRAGILSWQGGCFQDAERLFARACAVQPGNFKAHFNRGLALKVLKRFDDALLSYERALSLKPDFAEAHNNRANILRDLQRNGEALASYNRAIDINAHFADALYNKARLLLLLGCYEEGWQLFEWRWRSTERKVGLRRFSRPVWLGGETLSGKTILLHAEQGIGDTIQFARYVPLVAASGAKVIVEVPAPLVSLFHTLPGKVVLVGQGSVLPQFDVHCPLMSLPLAFRTTLETIPAPTAYLAADRALSQRWAQRFGEDDGLKVGLVWAGNPTMSADRHRSLPLSSFAVLGDIAGVRFFSLQVGPASAQLAELRQAQWDGPEIADFTGDIRDWADTAALVDNLDLVIACDTATAHLAAAMGKPTWILNRHDSDWRWLTDREDSPWYPSVRLFRQPRPGDWRPVLSRVKAELLRLAMQP